MKDRFTDRLVKPTAIFYNAPSAAPITAVPFAACTRTADTGSASWPISRPISKWPKIITPTLKRCFCATAMPWQWKHAFFRGLCPGPSRRDAAGAGGEGKAPADKLICGKSSPVAKKNGQKKHGRCSPGALRDLSYVIWRQYPDSCLQGPEMVCKH